MTRKTALVTGGVGGIGSFVCRELAHKGFRVIAGYHPAEEDRAKAMLKEWQGESLAISIVPGDVSSFSACAAMAQETGPVDALVNCAGITRDKTLKKMAEEDW